MNIVSLLNVSFLHLEHTRKSCERDIDNIQLCHVPGCITHTPVCVITTGFQARSRGGRWSWAAKVGLLSLQVVPQ